MSDSQQTSLKIKNVQRKHSGVYEINLTNSLGSSNYKVQVLILDVPGQPHGRIEFPSIESDSVTIAWQPPVDNGGTPITGYVIHYKSVGQQSWSPVTACTAKTRYTVRNLQRKETYQFKVSAENVIGCGEALVSGKCTVDYGFTTPDKPGKPAISNVTKTTAHVAWKAPKSGPEVTGYHVELKEKGTTAWRRDNTNIVHRCDYTLKGKMF